MTAHVIIPMHNRASLIPGLIKSLREQNTTGPLRFIFVDSGSIDSSASQILEASQLDHRFHLVAGKSDWWWARAVQEGIEFALLDAGKDDIVVLLNDDVTLAANFFETGIRFSQDNPGTVWGSGLRVIGGVDEFKISTRTKDLRVHYSDLAQVAGATTFDQSLISGRGAFYPVKLFSEGIGVRFNKIPHYLADYDLSSQAKLAGYTLKGSSNLFVLSDNNFGSSPATDHSYFWRAFATESPDRLLSHFHFWSVETGQSLFGVAVRFITSRLLGLGKKRVGRGDVN